MKDFDGLQLRRVLHDERETVFGQRAADFDVSQVGEELGGPAQLSGGHGRQRNFSLDDEGSEVGAVDGDVGEVEAGTLDLQTLQLLADDVQATRHVVRVDVFLKPLMVGLAAGRSITKISQRSSNTLSSQ